MFEQFNNNSERDRKLCEDFGVEPTEKDDWHEGNFSESFYGVLQLLDSAKTPEKRREYLVNMYVDAFFNNSIGDSIFEDLYSFSPPRRSFVSCDDWRALDSKVKNAVFVGKNIELMDPKAETYYYPKDKKLTWCQYGSARLFQVLPGQFCFIPKAEIKADTVIGSDHFTGCSALIIQVDAGVFYSHITTEDFGVRKIVDSLPEKLRKAKITLVRPTWDFVAGGKNDNYEARWKILVKDYPEISQLTYAYIAEGSRRPNSIDESSILFTSGKIITVGAEITNRGKRKYDFSTLKELS